MKWKSILSCIFIFVLIIMLAGINYNVSAFEYDQFNNYDSNIKFEEDYKYDFSGINFLIENNNFHQNNRFNRFASITQNGFNNESTICQIGNIGSIVELMQIGDKNKANINQIANFAKTEVFQFGSNLDVSVDHWRSDTDIYIIQSGTNKYNERVKIIEFR
ncbi:MAG: hypothetical protein ACOCRO_00450 [Halanaerobiales bacterium]